MAKLSRIADVQIALRTTGIAEQSFSDLIIVGDHALSVSRVLAITGADELLDMGMASTDSLYKAASDVFSQMPHINKVYIGRRLVSSATITVGTAAAGDYTATIGWRNGTTGEIMSAKAKYTALVSNTTSQIATGLAAAITALSATVSVTTVGNVITVTGNPSGSSFSVSVGGNLTTANAASAEPLAATMAACAAELGNWYGVMITSRTESDVLAAADWVEANEKLFFTSSAQAAILDGASTTDVASKLKQAQYFRTAIWYHGAANSEFIDGAAPGHLFTFYPGQETWALKRLAGITYDALQEGKAIAAHAKNANTFEVFRNFAVTQNGKVAAGEWIDVIRFRDWLVEQIRINVVSALINADGKVPYTDDGIQIIRNALQKALDLGVARKGIAPEELDSDGRKIPSYTITVPRSADVSVNNKANRLLQDVRFTARLAGAINVVEIRGSLAYAL